MAAKYIAITCLIAAVQCSDFNSHGPVQTSFAYGVLDPHTGDIKSQHETRIGNQVVGQYSFHDADGTRRTVDYSADDHNGFNAVVRKDPLYVHETPVVANIAPVVAIVAPMLAKTYASGYDSDYSAPLTNGFSNSYNPPLTGGYANGHAAPLNNEYSRGFNGYGAVPAPYIIGING